MEFRILGPLEVSRDGRPVAVTGRHHPKLLAVLLLEAGRVVPVHRLIEALWEEDPPTTARRQVQNTLASLRRQLAGPGAPEIEAAGEGYRIVVPDEAVDARRFAELARRGRAARDDADLATACHHYGEALELWRGEALAGLSGRVVDAAVLRLAETRLTTLEDRCETDIALGRHGLVIGELRELLEHHPYRQRVAGLLMTALHHNGRTPEALEVYAELRSRLSRELGLDPGPELTRLHSGILRGEVAGPHTAEPRPGPARPAQLPADTATFTGRREHLATLGRLLDGGRTAAVVSSIEGMGGAGKTALAVHWAHRVRHRFPDGQLYLNLRGYDDGPPVAPADALARFLTALGQPGTAIPGDVDEAGAMYRSLLADRSMLILLDNARDAAQVRPLLPGGGGNFAVVTSRDRLTSLAALDDAAPIRLDTLGEDESLELLSQILSEDRVRAEPEAAGRLARLCGHLPLALRIAAANLAERPATTIGRFVSELEGPTRLDHLAIPDDPDVAVTRTLDMSVGALRETELRVLAVLGILPGDDISHELAAHLAGADGATGADAITVLESAHLLQQHRPGRYRFHDLVRLHARRLAESVLDDSARSAVVDAYIAWHHGKDGELGDDENENILAGCAMLADRPDVWRLATALRRGINSGYALPRIQRELEHGLEAAVRSGDREGQFRMTNMLGSCHGSAGELVTASRYAENAVGFAHNLGSRELGLATSTLGTVLQHRGRLREAEAALRRSLDIATELDDPVHRQNRAYMLGYLYRLMAEFDKSREYLALAESLGGRCANPGMEIPIRLASTDLMIDMGRYQEAGSALDSMSAELTDATPVPIMCSVIGMTADLLYATGDLSGAREARARSRDLARQHKLAYFDIDSTSKLAVNLTRLGRHAEALELISSHPARTDDDGQSRYAADFALAACVVYTGTGELGTAVEYGRRAVALFEPMPRPLKHRRALLALADARSATGDLAAAKRCRAEAETIRRRLKLTRS